EIKKLMNSRLGQMFYWPDLKRFPLGAEHMFDLSARSAPKVKGAVTKGSGISVAAVIPLSLRQWAPDPSYVRYVDFYSDGNGAINLKVKDAMLTIDFSVDNLNFSYQFDKDYLKKHPNINTKIAINTFEEKIQDSLLTKSWQFKIPEITLPGKQLLG